MKLNFIAHSVLAAGIGCALFCASCTNKQTTLAPANTSGTAATGKIAYVNVDTLQAHYTYFKSEAEALEKEQQQAEADFQRSAQQLQNDIAAFQQKAQSGGYGEADGKAAQQRLAQAQQALEAKRTSESERLQKKQLAFSEQLQKNIDNFLAEYNKDGKYDFILSYSKAGPILFANKSLDITADVIKGLNSAVPATSAETK